MIKDQLATIGNTIQRDQTLADRLNKATNKDEALSVFLDAGRANGYTLSADELDRELTAGTTQRTNAQGEMSDQQLEAVAGGAWYHDAWYKLVTTGGYACK